MNEDELISFLGEFGILPITIQKVLDCLRGYGQVLPETLEQILLSSGVPEERVNYIRSNYERELQTQLPYQQFSYQQPDMGQTERVRLLKEKISKMEIELNEIKEKNAKIDFDYMRSQIAKLEDTVAQQSRTLQQQQQVQQQPIQNPQMEQMRLLLKQAQETVTTPPPTTPSPPPTTPFTIQVSPSPTPPPASPEIIKKINRLESMVADVSKKISSPQVVVERIPEPKPSQPPEKKITWQEYIGVPNHKGIGRTWDDDYLDNLVRLKFTSDYVENRAEQRGLLPIKKDKGDNEEEDEEE